MPFAVYTNHTEKLVYRTLITLKTLPKVFFACFLWEGFGLFSTNVLHHSSTTGVFYVFTGIGSASGVLVGAVLLNKLLGASWRDLHSDLLVSMCAFVVGLIWQILVNASLALGHPTNFTISFFFVFVIVFISWLTLLEFFRYVNSLIHEDNLFKLNIDGPIPKWKFDALLSISLASGDAFFVGTDIVNFTDSWLHLFGVYPSTSTFVALCLSGSSAMCGFLIAQSIQNLILPVTWTDKPAIVLMQGEEDYLPEQGEIRNSFNTNVDGSRTSRASIGSRFSVNNRSSMNARASLRGSLNYRKSQGSSGLDNIEGDRYGNLMNPIMDESFLSNQEQSPASPTLTKD